MLRSLLYTALWAAPVFGLYVLFRWATKPHCPHCQCENYLDDTAFTPRSRTKLVVIDRHFACGYGISPDGQQTGTCRRIAYTRRTA